MKSYDWKESNDDWQILSYKLSKILDLLKICSKLSVQDVSIFKTCIIQLFARTWIKQICTKTSALTSGLAANPTNMTVIRKKYNKKSNKESKNYKKEVS
jgi:hypothetical protein